ncbi:MAG: MBL fold metallo-hydrolase [Planctomycetes bacterium]|nr:MBL fold metallo-hydrolase [Planctomycetota bacterium]
MNTAIRLLACLPWIVAAANAAPGDDVQITWHGQSFFEVVSSKGTRVVFDPHGIENFGKNSVSADMVLLSHPHTDHTRVDVLANAGKFEVVKGWKDQKESAQRVTFNPIDQQFKDVRIASVPSFHDDQGGLRRGINTIWILEIDGIRIAHLGDLGHVLTPAQTRPLKYIDVLMIPVGGVYTINGAEAREVARQVNPRRMILPMHYGSKVYEDLLPVDEFLEEQTQGSVERVNGNSLTVSSKIPPAWRIRLLSHEPSKKP